MPATASYLARYSSDSRLRRAQDRVVWPWNPRRHPGVQRKPQEICRDSAATRRTIARMAFYLVTGAAGFIGSSLVRELVRRGEQVRGLDNLETGKHENLAPVLNQMEFFEIDIRDEERLPQAFKGIDYVLHQAALPSV